MKQIFFLISTLLILVSESKCQQEMVWGTFYLGPFISHKAGVNLNHAYPGEKKIIRINSIPDFGVTFFHLFSKEPQNHGIIAELGFSTYSFKHIMQFDENKYMSAQTSCLTATSCYNIFGFSIGPIIGFPVNRELYVSDTNIIVKRKKMNLFLGLNFDYLITLLEIDKNKLNFHVNVQLIYTIMDRFSVTDKISGYESDYASGILSFGIGLNYLFKLGD